MGLCLSRGDLSEPERAITQKEHDLGFESHRSERLDLVLRKFSHNEQLNDTQFAEAFKLLDLHAASTQSNTNIATFYNSLKVGSFYSLKYLLLVAVLLGEGSSRSKAKVLFEIYDFENSRKLSLEKVVHLCRDVFEVAVNKLTIVSDTSKPLVSDYIHKLRLNRGNAESSLKKLLIGDHPEVTLEQFIKAFDGEELEHFLKSHGARTYFFKYQSTLSPATFKKSESIVKQTTLDVQPSATTASHQSNVKASDQGTTARVKA
mmetsp:Transcript_13677/g.25808  ORF Transcript_13677/g.25808 Transcript_13677/m.25808 type:complete len:261 (+) Transcript_13677:91-873(+)